MFRTAKKRLAVWVLVTVGLYTLGLTAALAAQHKFDGTVQRLSATKAAQLDLKRGRGTLDDDYTQLLYVKTTDYGASWSGMTRAGEMQGFAERTAGFPDFSATVSTDGQLVYAVILHEAATPGAYVLKGPNFTPVLAIAKGSEVWDTSTQGEGWSEVGRTPNGDMFVIVWGHSAGGANTIWAAKSTNDGASFGAPWVVITEPALPASAAYPHISDMNSANYCFVLFQTEGATGYDQHVLRFPTSGGTGTFVSLNDYSDTEFSYYTGNCSPIAYDAAANALYVVFRNRTSTTSPQAVATYYSHNEAASFSAADVGYQCRYPSVTVRTADQLPYVVSNRGAAANPHFGWNVYDEAGYNGGAWTQPDTMYGIPNEGGAYGLLYMNFVGWWDANRGMAATNLWGNVPAITPAGIMTARTTNGGADWIDFGERWNYIPTSMEWATVQNAGLVTGPNGVAWAYFCGHVGDVANPSYVPSLVTSPTSLGPYVVSCHAQDQNVDPADIHIYWYNPRIDVDGYPEGNTSTPDSSNNVDATGSGNYFFTIPALNSDGSSIAQGDSIWFYCDGNDLLANYGTSWEQLIRAGIDYQDADEPGPAAANSFTLYGNYPNPFNPETQIMFDLPRDARVSLAVFNTLGQTVRVLAEGLTMSAGTHRVTFNAADLPSGIYLYRLTANGVSHVGKMALVK
jgi:hypothetical protein